MPTQQQDKDATNTEGRGREQRHAAICGHVLHALGQPGGLYEVEVRPLWQHHYRVNVLVGADAASVRVAHSFFLVTGGDGKILASTPKITRQYEPAATRAGPCAGLVIPGAPRPNDQPHGE
jgi:hypothetical protein